MRARDDTDRVELDAAERADRLQQPRLLPLRIAGRPRSPVQPRGDRCQRPRFLEGEMLSGHRTMPIGKGKPLSQRTGRGGRG